MTVTDPCAICALEVDDDAVRDLGNGWSASVPAGRAPWSGWLTVHPLQHRRSVADLDPAEALAAGPLLQAGCAALQRLCGVENVYVANWAEVTPHVHFHLVPRPEQLATPLLAAGAFAANARPADDRPPVPEQRSLLAAFADTVRRAVA